MSDLAATFVTKSYAKKGKPMANGKPKPQRPRSPMKQKSADAQLSLKPVKKASAGSNKMVAKAGEAQRREMARTRLKQQQGRLTAQERAKVTTRDKNAAQDRMGRATTKRFKRGL